MKKAIVMAGVLFALTMTAGCGSQNQDHAATAESDVTENEEEALQDNENTEKSSKVLVAYYSATGNTKAAAETIADAAGGELFELQPAEAYTTEAWIIMIRKAVSAKNMRIRIRSRTG